MDYKRMLEQKLEKEEIDKINNLIGIEDKKYDIVFETVKECKNPNHSARGTYNLLRCRGCAFLYIEDRRVYNSYACLIQSYIYHTREKKLEEFLKNRKQLTK
jgi:hypothetical protein